jgi:cation diffusion facilitator CzcD-associated flavoprotein CzcO
MSEQVLVIGAGPAGLASAYYLERAGIPYRVVDRAPVIASTWANLYPSLKLNTAGFVSHLPGRRMPLRYGVFPSGRQLYEYLTAYAEEHQFNIHLNVDVRRVAPHEGGWWVETSEGNAVCPTVIIATGRFGNPFLPEIAGMETFEGRALHAHDFRDPADFAGQRVLVVGNGPSGADIALALAPIAAKPTLLAIRSDMVLARRYPFGLPETIWKMVIDPLPEVLRKPLTDRIIYQGYPGTEKLGIRLAPNRVERVGSSAPVRGPELIAAIRAGTVKPVAGLKQLDERQAVLLDDSRHTVDAVILCTGYRPVLNYLDLDYETDSDGWPLRVSDDSTEIAGAPGLYLVGRFYRGLGPLHNIRAEARTAVRLIERRLAANTPASTPQTTSI